jgi:hypothetical protein
MIAGGVILFILANQFMFKFQFNSYNMNGATITTAAVFLTQTVLIAAWKMN